jgi:hypothetical protein
MRLVRAKSTGKWGDKTFFHGDGTHANFCFDKLTIYMRMIELTCKRHEKATA